MDFCQKSYEKTPVFITDIKSSFKFLLSNKEYLKIFDNETTVLKLFFEICKETRFRCWFSLNGKIVAICHLITNTKCTAVTYFIENWSMKSDRFEITDRLIWRFNFLTFLFLLFFVALLQKSSCQNYHFLIKIFEIHFKIYYFGEFYDLKPAGTKMTALSK